MRNFYFDNFDELNEIYEDFSFDELLTPEFFVLVDEFDKTVSQKTQELMWDLKTQIGEKCPEKLPQLGFKFNLNFINDK